LCPLLRKVFSTSEKVFFQSFIKGIFGLLFAIALGILVFFRAGKDKFPFQKVSGIVTSLDKTNENFPNKDFLKFRYLENWFPNLPGF